ncbi:ArsR family transcriptional regulator [Haloarcula laminariae]|uniref:ArsR family transcriptional regulator n=1 Tax=Haloarcula laminariae TaxID=2961577 RepID=UPI0021CAE1D0|nr:MULTISPECIES: ArsR family transcriptional regulator [Halomicroarcula]
MPHQESDTKLGHALEVLSNSYRRELLLALLEHNPQDDADRDPLDIIDPPLEPEVLEVELFHEHLPKLEELGFIEWDRDTGKISKGPDWADIEPVLRLIADHRNELPADWL